MKKALLKWWLSRRIKAAQLQASYHKRQIDNALSGLAWARKQGMQGVYNSYFTNQLQEANDGELAAQRAEAIARSKLLELTC